MLKLPSRIPGGERRGGEKVNKAKKRQAEDYSKLSDGVTEGSGVKDHSVDARTRLKPVNENGNWQSKAYSVSRRL